MKGRNVFVSYLNSYDDGIKYILLKNKTFLYENPSRKLSEITEFK